MIKNLSCLLVDQSGDSKDSETSGDVVTPGYGPIGHIYPCEKVGIDVIAKLGRKVEEAKRRFSFAR